MHHSQLLILFLACCFVAPSLSAQIYYDTAARCVSATGGCSFLNASIWLGGVVPSANDSASILGPSGSWAYIFFPDDSYTMVSTIIVQNAQLAVNKAKLVLSDALGLFENSTFNVITGTAQTQFTTIVSNALLAVYEGAFNSSTVDGSGEIRLRGAMVTIASQPASPSNFSGIVTVAGNSVVSFQHVTLSNFAAYAGTNTIADNLAITGPVSINGIWTAINNGLTLTQTATLVGALNVVNSSLTITQSFAITAGSSFTLQNSTINLAGQITGNVDIPETSKLVAKSGTIVGNLLNNGALVLSGANSLSVSGTVTLTQRGDVQATLDAGGAPVLNVYNSSLMINGTIHYKLEKLPLFKKSQNFIVAETINGSIYGAFIGSATALAGSAVTRNLALAYTTTTVSAVYTFAPLKDTPTWVWVVVSLSIVVVVAALAGVIVVKCRARRHYASVH